LNVRDRESIQEAVRRFRKLVERSGIKKEMRRREYYEKPSETRRRARLRAARRGRANLLAGQGRECRTRSMPAAMTVNGGRAALTFHRGDTLEGTITSDGMVRFADGAMAANGTFQGRRMSGEASRQGCTYHLSLTKR
jgi:small subunit ribosomal protein S21